MQVFFAIAYFMIGLVQLVAIMDGIGYALHIGHFVAGIIAFFVTYIPLIGSIAGVYGAVNVWHWSALQAALLFFWYVPVIIAVVLFAGASTLFSRKP